MKLAWRMKTARDVGKAQEERNNASEPIVALVANNDDLIWGAREELE